MQNCRLKAVKFYSKMYVSPIVISDSLIRSQVLSESDQSLSSSGLSLLLLSDGQDHVVGSMSPLRQSQFGYEFACQELWILKFI